MDQHYSLEQRNFHAVFFDLDGTLVDTAPDMVSVLLHLQQRHGRSELPYATARNNVSNGAIGLLKVAFPGASDEMLANLQAEYLEDYSKNLCRLSSVFAPLGEFLLELVNAGRIWGVVTNKPERMTLPLLDGLGIRAAAACVVSGDSLAERKPHPAPLLHAARIAGIEPASALYIGDAKRDIDAGNAAGMTTVAVGYGYITDDDDPNRWGAVHYVADTMSLIHLLREALGLKMHE